MSSEYPSWLLNLQVRKPTHNRTILGCLFALCISKTARLTGKSYWISGTQLLQKYRRHPPQNCRRQMGDTKQVHYKGPTTTSIRYYGTNFSHRGNLVPGICASLYWTSGANPIWRSGLAEGYTMRQCTVPLDQAVDRDSPGHSCEVLHSLTTSFQKKDTWIIFNQLFSSWTQ
jgi:hypothetical protein